MTDLRKSAEMALEALEDSMYPQKKQFDAIVGLKQALAQPEQEPVAWLSSPNFIEQETVEGRPRRVWFECNAGVGIPFYTAPPRKEWIGLTDEEVHEAAIKCVKSGQSVNAAIRAIEAKLKERNNG